MIASPRRYDSTGVDAAERARHVDGIEVNRVAVRL